jgi:hypothetical protein
MRIYAWLILLILFSSIAYAGVLTVDRTVGPGGTTFTLTWRQGCPTGLLGPNQCHPDEERIPLWCPLDSTGSTSLRNNASVCGCPIHFKPDLRGEDCDACPNPCDSCPSGTTCTPPTTDWCTTPPVCVPNTPIFIGYYSISGVGGNLPTCSNKRGQILYGTPLGDGTYFDCYNSGRACASGFEFVRPADSALVGYTDELCSGFSGRYSVWDGRECRCDSFCTSDCSGSSGGDNACNGDNECPHTSRSICLDAVWKQDQVASGICTYDDPRKCDYDDWESVGASVDCSRSSCFGIPMICSNGECVCT